jgi:hypothetical protein
MSAALRNGWKGTGLAEAARTVHSFEQAQDIRLTPNQREKLNDQTSALRIFGVFHNMAVRLANAAKISALMNATQRHS